MENNYFSRRKFLKNSLFGLGGLYLAANFISCDNDDDAVISAIPENPDRFGFDQGVASFDPTESQIIIWTRYSAAVGNTNIIWQMASDAGFTQIVRQGEITTDASRDYTVSVEVQNLDENRKFYYRFIQPENAHVSDIGETITMPANPSMLKLAVCSCSNFPAGLFNVYRAVAESDADIVVHLGDYIYEYGEGQYGTNEYTSLNNRTHSPNTEILSLGDYRNRYKQYRTDADLKLAHQKKPFICVWDDHEIANDTYKDGAQNHNPGEGSFEARKQAAVQAFSEYLPMMTTDINLIYRNFTYGNLINLIMLDTRVVGRDLQLSYADYYDSSGAFDAVTFQQDWLNPARSILGTTQRDWLIGKVTGSSATWQVLGQQVLMAKIILPAELLATISQVQTEAALNGSASPETFMLLQQQLGQLATIKQRALAGDPTLTPSDLARIQTALPYNLDAWDGYPAEREYLYAAFTGKKVISLAGDTHNAWQSELKGLTSTEASGVEFATASVSSPGLEEYLGADAATIAGFEQVIQLLIDDLQYLNASERGYMKVTFTAGSADAEWIFASSVFQQQFTMTAKNSTSYSG